MMEKRSWIDTETGEIITIECVESLPRHIARAVCATVFLENIAGYNHIYEFQEIEPE